MIYKNRFFINVEVQRPFDFAQGDEDVLVIQRNVYGSTETINPNVCKRA